MQRGRKGESGYRVPVDKFSTYKESYVANQGISNTNQNLLENYDFHTSFIEDKLSAENKKQTYETLNEQIGMMAPPPIKYATNEDNHLQDVKTSLHEHPERKDLIPGIFVYSLLSNADLT